MSKPKVVEGCITEESRSGRRRWFVILFVLAGVVQLARIGYVRSNTGEMPFLSANDRSRWCTILALTANGSFVIDDVLEIRDRQTQRRTWYSIDIVQHRGSDGVHHYYSSKPPLLTTLYAGVYWLVRSVTGATLTGQPFLVVRTMLVIVNLLPLMGLWWLLMRWADQHWLSDGQAVTLAIFAVLGTFLSTFVITLNNHLPAAVGAAVSLVCLLRILVDNHQHPGWFILCGLATSFMVACELPALSWLLMVGTLLCLVNWRRTLAVYLPSALPILFAFLGMNYLAHGTIRPAYSMRGLGKLIAETNWPLIANENDSNATDGNLSTSARAIPSELVGIGPAMVAGILRNEGFELSPEPIIRKARRDGVWELWDETSQWKFALKPSDDGKRLGIYHWGDWYDFPTSYWKDDRKQGVDRGEPSRLRYAAHCLIGHHGILSLTPFWLVSLAGVMWIVIRTPQANWWTDREFQLTVAIALTSAIVVGFYIARPLEDRNYGGVTSGLRWMFWFVPLWFWLAVRGIRLVHGRWLWMLVMILLAISVFSATYPWSNPWTNPWLTRWVPL